MIPILPHILHNGKNGEFFLPAVQADGLNHTPQGPRPADPRTAVDPDQVLLLDLL